MPFMVVGVMGKVSPMVIRGDQSHGKGYSNGHLRGLK
jgi:hypothetical protein